MSKNKINKYVLDAMLNLNIALHNLDNQNNQTSGKVNPDDTAKELAKIIRSLPNNHKIKRSHNMKINSNLWTSEISCNSKFRLIMTSTKGVSAKHNAKLAFDVWDSMKEKRILAGVKMIQNKIYRINFDDGTCYIGVTSQPLKKRINAPAYNGCNVRVYKKLKAKMKYTVDVLATENDRAKAFKTEQKFIWRQNKPILNRNKSKKFSPGQYCTWHQLRFAEHEFSKDCRRSSGYTSRCRRCIAFVGKMRRILIKRNNGIALYSHWQLAKKYTTMKAKLEYKNGYILPETIPKYGHCRTIFDARKKLTRDRLAQKKFRK